MIRISYFLSVLVIQLIGVVGRDLVVCSVGSWGVVYFVILYSKEVEIK